METSSLLMQTLTVAIAVGVGMQVLAAKFKMPSIVFLMFSGILLGPNFLNIIQPKTMGHGLEIFASMAVALILFEGVLSLDFKSLAKVDKAVRKLTTVGLALTILGSALTAHLLLDLSWQISFLFGAIMSEAGITIVVPLLQRLRLKPEIATVLKSECVISDTIGAIISVAVLEIVLASKQANLVYIAYEFIHMILVGLLTGFLMGWLLSKTLKRRYIDDELKNLVVFAWVFGTFYLSNLIQPNTGILAVVVVGLAVKRENIPQLNTLKKFKGQLSTLFISILFVLVSANFDLDNLYKLGWKGFAVVLLIATVVRPIVVFVSTHGLMKTKEKLLLSFLGTKGIIAGSVASLFAMILIRNGFPEAQAIVTLVFLIIMVLVPIQGLFAPVVAKFCDCLADEGNIIIVGANALGRTLGAAFKEIGKKVVIVDSNNDYCKLSLEAELETIQGNALDNEVLETANIGSAAIVIATTANSEVNFLVCQMAKDLYKVPNVYPAIDSPDKGINSGLVEDIGGNLAYARPVSIQDWKDAIDRDNVKIVDVVLQGDKPGKLKDLDIDATKDADNQIPLILKRKDGYYFVHADQEWSNGDILIYLDKYVV